jgi:hypothetical protein
VNIAKRNDVNQPGEEVLVFRHYRILKGFHRQFQHVSQRDIWWAYEKLGVVNVGDFKVVYPEGGEPQEYDENYRLARYVSYDHWLDTRQPQKMMGDGPLFDAVAGGSRTREQYVLSSDGAYFLTGRMIEAEPYYLPGLDEDYVLDTASSSDATGPVRYDHPVLGDEIAEVIWFRIAKGRFDEFDALTRDDMLPVIRKMGVRGLGIWKLIYPAPAIGEENDDYDEVMMIMRYASYQHWQACKSPARLIGDGPDYQAYAAAESRRDELTLGKRQRFIKGIMFGNPAAFTPPLPESYTPAG